MKALLALAMLLLGAVLSGLLLSQLLDWFAVPLGAPAIGTAHALGLSLMVQSFVPRSAESDKAEEWWEPVVTMFARLFFILLFGWLIHAVMVSN